MAAKEHDYVIVGAGAAGCVLAARLSEDASVLLLEAGGAGAGYLFRWPAGFARMTKGVASWGWSTVPQRHMGGRSLWYTQAKVRGGGSAINAQIYTRGHPLDYDGWRDDAGCEGWGWRDVLPYFRRSEGNERWADEHHGAEGPLGISTPRSALPIADAFIRAAQQYGLPYNPDFNGARQEGVGQYQLSIRDGRRSAVSFCYLDPIKDRKSLEVELEAEVGRVVLEKGRAVGVEAGGQLRRARREVIVAAGAIGSPRLLQLSGIGPAAHLEKAGVKVACDLPAVGENLQDHVNLCALCECSGDHSYDSVLRPHRLLAAGIQYLLFGTGPVMSPLFETGGFWYSDKQARSPEIQFHFGQGSGIEKGIAKLDNPGVTLNSAYLRPRSRGTVRLASANPADPPLIDPNYWAEPADLEDSLRGLEMAREIMAQPALKPFIKREVLPGPAVGGKDKEKLFDYACRMGKTDHHPVGTCRMGGGEDSAVDPQLRLRGVEALRVCDSSVMPAVVSSNTNAATIMVAERGADLIAGKAPLPPAA